MYSREEGGYWSVKLAIKKTKVSRFRCKLWSGNLRQQVEIRTSDRIPMCVQSKAQDVGLRFCGNQSTKNQGLEWMMRPVDAQKINAGLCMCMCSSARKF